MDKRQPTKDELDFISGLDQRLHYIHTQTYTPNISGNPFDISVDQFTDKTLSEDDLERLLKILDNTNLVFFPKNTNWGFSVGFRITYIPPRFGVMTSKDILTFKEAQLPEGYSFDRLSEYFMRPSNIQRAKSIGVEFVNDRSHYTY
ncbi:hypothetical protein JXC34_03400 [Candidatus Woesearchaeota archaeon]|nr:hypothetical protein [Candidatus Woesearchaeota archaeon]